MQNEVQVFDNLKVKQENGQVMFDAESAAIKIGLTKQSKGNTYVRWERVNEWQIVKLNRTPCIKKLQRL